MNNERKNRMRSKRIALSCAAILIGAATHPARGTDLGVPELRPVTKDGVNIAIGAEIELASRRMASIIGSSASLVSAIVQQGAANHVSLTQAGKSNRSNIDQQGHANSVSANQQSQFNSLDVSQQGNSNSANFNQTGGARASVIQAGDAHKADIFQTSASPSVIVRQSGVGTVVQTTQY